jgi:DNA polymerase III delta prime subunit
VTTGELDDLPYASGARFDLGKQCLPGTREDVLEKIFAWANSDADMPRILVLNGAPGSGKSTIAHTVSRRFNELRRLGSSFFFRREHPERSPDKLFSTIARDLADLDPEWKEALKQVVGPRALRKTGSIQEQFEEFILKPATRPSVYFGPVLIVIDALDAAVDPNALRKLISLLSSRAAELPSNFRILITARPDPDICRAFEKRVGIAWWPMHVVIDEKSNLRDIDEFFNNELSSVLGPKWSDKACQRLVRKSEGDFGWAAFACGYIKHIGGRMTPSDRMRRLLSHPKETPAADLEAEGYPDSDCEGFFHDRIRDRLHIPHMLSNHHSVFDNIWHPHAAHKYPHAVNVAPPFPVPLGHPGHPPPGPWLTSIPGVNHHYAQGQFVDESKHY